MAKQVYFYLLAYCNEISNQKNFRDLDSHTGCYYREKYWLGARICIFWEFMEYIKRS